MTHVQARKLTAPSADCIYGAALLQPDAAVLDWTPPDVHRQRKNLVPRARTRPLRDFQNKTSRQNNSSVCFYPIVFLQLQN